MSKSFALVCMADNDGKPSVTFPVKGIRPTHQITLVFNDKKMGLAGRSFEKFIKGTRSDSQLLRVLHIPELTYHVFLCSAELR